MRRPLFVLFALLVTSFANAAPPPPPCVPPKSVCPNGKIKIGDFNSPAGAGWGKGTFSVCLEGPQKVTSSWCSAQFFPNSDHKCDDYKGYSSIVKYGNKKYCVYQRTDSQYYKALEIDDKPSAEVSLNGLHYPALGCPAALADYKTKVLQDARLVKLCKAKLPNSVPVDVVKMECVPGTKENLFNSGAVISVTVKCE